IASPSLAGYCIRRLFIKTSIIPGEPSPVLQLIVVLPGFVPAGTGFGHAAIKAPFLRGSWSEEGGLSGLPFCLTVTEASKFSCAAPPYKRTRRRLLLRSRKPRQTHRSRMRNVVVFVCRPDPGRPKLGVPRAVVGPRELCSLRSQRPLAAKSSAPFQQGCARPPALSAERRPKVEQCH